MRALLGGLCCLLLFAYPVPLSASNPEFDAEAEAAAIKSLRSFASNIQKNRDGSVRFVRFSKAVVTDEIVQVVSAFSRIDYLAVVVKQVGDKGLMGVDTLKNLDTLCLSNTGITRTTVERAVRLPKLERLYLDGTDIGDDAVELLSGHAALSTLDLAGAKISSRSAKALASLKQLETLSLASTDFDSGGLPALSELKKLRYLVLSGTKVSDVTPLLAYPQLQVIDLSNTKIDASAVLTLTKSKTLKQIIVRGVALSPEELEAIALASSRILVTASPSGEERFNALQKYLQGEALRSAPVVAATSDVAISQRLGGASSRFDAEDVRETPDFQRHVVPLLGRLGCNGRTCHGSFQGRGGFRLSMFGYDFAADWTAIHGDEYSRVDIDDPKSSLLLRKPTEQDPHEGGLRFRSDGWEHKLLQKWIAGGAKGQPKNAPKLVRFRVTPSEIVFDKSATPVQLKCVAEWSDGVSEDVTCLTRFQSNSDAVAAVDKDGRVSSLGPGDTHVIAFYDKGVVSVPVMRPFGPSVKIAETEATAPIDRFVNRKLEKLGLTPSTRSADVEFLRRVSLDLIGTLPSPAEVDAFSADTKPDKRERLVERLLNSPAYVEWWTMRLADLTGSNAQSLGSTDMNSPAAGQWVSWLRRRVKDNVGWDRIAAGLILATSRRPGQDYDDYSHEQSGHLARREPTDFTALDNPMHYYWFRSNNQSPSDRALAFSYVFLGIRLECAQCHKHPFDRWSKQDFDQFTQFFTRIKAGVAPESRESQKHLKTKLGVPKKLDTAALRRQMYMRVAAEGLSIPWNEIWIEPGKSKPQTARLLGGEAFDLNAFDDPREPLFAWLMAEGREYFAKAFVNRIWFQYMGRGLVEPPDDFNQANPPSHPQLLDWLAEEFVANGYDMKWLHKQIVLSETYQRSSLANDSNAKDERNYSRSLIRRLPAEVAVDAILQATAMDTVSASWSEQVKQRKIAQHPKSYQARGVDYSLLVFGKPLRTTNCDCERQLKPTLLQSIYRRNDQDIMQSIERNDGWLNEVAKRIKQPLTSETAPPPKTPPARPATRLPRDEVSALIDDCFLRTVSRRPTTAEKQRAQRHFADAESDIEALRDLVWAMLNAKEFITNH